MNFRHRPMKLQDVRECVEIVASQPVVRNRYGASLDQLGAVWLQLLGCDGMSTGVIEAHHGGKSELCFVGVGLCVSDDFVRELKVRPTPWIGPELIRRIVSGASPVLSDKQVREGNSREGLNLLVWEGRFRRGFESQNELYRAVMRAFVSAHEGFLWKEIIGAQAESLDPIDSQDSIQVDANLSKTTRLNWGPSTYRPENARCRSVVATPLSVLLEIPSVLTLDGATSFLKQLRNRCRLLGLRRSGAAMMDPSDLSPLRLRLFHHARTKGVDHAKGSGLWNVRRPGQNSGKFELRRKDLLLLLP